MIHQVSIYISPFLDGWFPWGFLCVQCSPCPSWGHRSDINITQLSSSQSIMGRSVILKVQRVSKVTTAELYTTSPLQIKLFVFLQFSHLPPLLTFPPSPPLILFSPSLLFLTPFNISPSSVLLSPCLSPSLHYILSARTLKLTILARPVLQQEQDKIQFNKVVVNFCSLLLCGLKSPPHTEQRVTAVQNKSDFMI